MVKTVLHLDQHAVHIYQLTLHTLLLLWVLWKGFPINFRVWMGQMLTGYGAEHMLISYVDGQLQRL
ncbi:hypothetical protein J2S00_001708 [Caldalkalibacillus uzonensis]|uniref:Uncharacterized protein n=1 Tax=Caldalkalibacillus uzonensis TaxID=353224 RepID=A0ABU0CRZ7_9BACI|nr:hypothetical protein [Caldalkalibacillus uzonensis]MDQ0338922.1 hypothetical protein [Caldalkalibacillus uzonensis]